LIGSIFDTLFTSEITIGSIFFVFFALYQAIREKGEKIHGRELLLLSFSTFWILGVVAWLGAALYIEDYNAFGGVSPALPAGLAAASVVLVWLSLLLLFGQAWLILAYLRERRTRAPRTSPSAPADSTSVFDGKED
jgi:hypothetical protein